MLVTTLNLALNLAALACYSAAGLYKIWAIYQQTPAANARPLPLMSIGVALHFFGLYLQINSSLGTDFSIYNMFSLTMAVINGLVCLSCLRKPLHNLFIFLSPLSITAIGLALWFHQPLIIEVSGNTTVHILLSIIAYSILSITALQAFLLGWQNHQLKNHRIRGWVKLLPPLQTMEVLMFELLWLGTALLTLAITTGFVFLDDMFGQQLTHKTALSLIAWCVFTGLLWGRYRAGWRGNLAVKWVLTGFSFLLLAYFGSKLVLEIIL